MTTRVHCPFFRLPMEQVACSQPPICEALCNSLKVQLYFVGYVKAEIGPHRVSQQDELDAGDRIHRVWPRHHASDGVIVLRRRCTGSTCGLSDPPQTAVASSERMVMSRDCTFGRQARELEPGGGGGGG